MTTLIVAKTTQKAPTYTNIRNLIKNALIESHNHFLSRLFLQGFTVEQKSDIEAIITNSHTGDSYTAFLIQSDLIIKTGKATHVSCKYSLDRSILLNNFLNTEKAVVISSEKNTVKQALVSSGCVLDFEAVDKLGLSASLAINNLITVTTIAAYGPVEHFFIDNGVGYKAKGTTPVRQALIRVIVNNGGSYQHQKATNTKKKTVKETLVEKIIRKAMIKGYKNIGKK